ncbi:MAG: type I-F CRISPR-associated endoribonuclease Cas6/Csy4 [Pararheinheimera sp.]|nr:type I-F CRISPR-associated endoribonuclease Cas6/Csy4 [Rheinheimera sp.]
MTRYYFMIRFLPKEANFSLLCGRCISVMHGYVSKHDLQGLGVSFPAWTNSSIGHLIAFVHSDISILDKLKQQAYFQEMQEYGVFEISSVQVVPADCPEVRFRRNQTISKMFVGGIRRKLKRAEKRAAARGEVFEPPHTMQLREFESFHAVTIASRSSGQDFCLNIQKDSVSKPCESHFNSYGLATNQLMNGSVPDFSGYLR